MLHCEEVKIRYKKIWLQHDPDCKLISLTSVQVYGEAAPSFPDPIYQEVTDLSELDMVQNDAYTTISK